MGDGTHVDYESAAAKFFVPGSTVLYLGEAEVISKNQVGWKARGILVHEFLIDNKVYKILSTFSYSGGGNSGFKRFEDAFAPITDQA
jgi:hypothetical protein